MTVLIVEDDQKLSRLFATVLTKHGYKTYQASNGLDAWDILESQFIDLVISDLMMPQMDGYEFISSLRDTNHEIPILIVTAKDDFFSKEKGFQIGSDDYMVKPIDVNEMVLRVAALLRRTKMIHDRKQTIGSTTFECDSLTVITPNEQLVLTQKEFYLLYKLISYPNKIFTRKQLMDEIWGMDTTSDTQTVDVHINRLRRHFESNHDFKIVTVRGLGYKAVIA